MSIYPIFPSQLVSSTSPLNLAYHSTIYILFSCMRISFLIMNLTLCLSSVLFIPSIFIWNIYFIWYILYLIVYLLLDFIFYCCIMHLLNIYIYISVHVNNIMIYIYIYIQIFLKLLFI